MLLQHFRGWTVRVTSLTARRLRRWHGHPDGLLRAAARRRRRLRLLPAGRHGTALVEYTEFSRQRLPSEAYDRALRAYLDRRWPGAEPVPGAVEDGVIPMTDGVFAARDGRRLFRLGTAGGATRASTGYTFAAMRRQAAGVAAALLEGRVPVPPAAYPGRHRWMDAVLLRALDGGRLRGAELLAGMFRAQPGRPDAAVHGRHEQPGRGARPDGDQHAERGDAAGHRERRAGPTPAPPRRTLRSPKIAVIRVICRLQVGGSPG